MTAIAWALLGLWLWTLGMLVIALWDDRPLWDELLLLLVWPVSLPIALVQRWAHRKRYSTRWKDDLPPSYGDADPLKHYREGRGG